MAKSCADGISYAEKGRGPGGGLLLFTISGQARVTRNAKAGAAFSVAEN